MLNTLTSQLIYVDDNASQGIDTRFVETGYVFNKKLSTDSLNFDVPHVTNLRTIFNGNESELEQFLKVALEYFTYLVTHGNEKHLPSFASHYEDVIQKTRLVQVMTSGEFTDYVNELFASNKALPQCLIEEMIPFSNLPIEQVKNKEVKNFMLEKMVSNGEYVNGYELVRYMNFLITGNSLYIHKNNRDYKKTYSDIPASKLRNILSNDNYQNNLAKVYNNHIKTFIWLRHIFNESGNKDLSHYINVVKRKAKKVKQLDFSIDYNIQILTKSIDEQEQLFKKNNFSLKQLLNMYFVKSMNDYYAQQQMKPYFIRNGKFFVDVYQPKNTTVINDTVLLKVLKNKFLEFDEIVLPTEYDLPIQFSEKRKLADMYFGTGIKLQVGDSIGIVWEDDVDLDLSLTDYTNNQHYSFYTNYTGKSFTHSGDCRTAGSEYITLTNDGSLRTRCGLYVNLFSYLYDDVSFRIIIKRGNEIVFQSSPVQVKKDKKQLFIGYIKNGKFILEVSYVNSSNISSAINILEKRTNIKYGNDKDCLDINSFLSNRNFVFMKDLLEKLEIPYISQSIFDKSENKRNFTLF